MADLPAHAHLAERGIPHERRSFDASIDKGAAAVAQALGFREHQMVKTLLFRTREGEHVLVMVGGDRSAISRHLKKIVGSKDVRLADPEAVAATTGYVVGSVPPFSWQPDGFRSFLDEALLGEQLLGVGAGERGEEILLAPADLQRASGAAIVNLTDAERPPLPHGD